MPFPKAPNKNAIGKLKLSIRSPETVVEVSSGPEPEGADLADNLAFKLPRGFKMFDSAKEANEQSCLKSEEALSKIKAKKETCKNCDDVVSHEALNNANLILLGLYAEANKNNVLVKSLISQTPTGIIGIQFTQGNKLVVFQFIGDTVLFGYYKDNFLREDGALESPSDWAPHADWLLLDEK